MKSEITKKQLKEFGFLIGITVPILFGFILPKLGGYPFKSWTLAIGIPFLIICLTKPILLFYPYKAWMQLGYILGWVNSRIILGLVFFIVLLPIAIIMRFIGHDPLRIKKNLNNSYREDKINHKTNLKKIF